MVIYKQGYREGRNVNKDKILEIFKLQRSELVLDFEVELGDMMDKVRLMLCEKT